MSLSKKVVEKIRIGRVKSSWLDQVDTNLVNQAIAELREVYREKKLPLDMFPLAHISLALRDLLGLSTESPYNQLKQLKQKLETLDYKLVKYGKSFAVKV